jgi:hypothetical protein
MEEFISNNNQTFIFKACKNMIEDKYNYMLPDGLLDTFLKNTFRQILIDKQFVNLKLNELNNITLGKIKTLFMNYINEQELNKKDTEEQYSQVFSESLLDDETISNKLKDLEFRRKIIPSFSDDNVDNIKQPMEANFTNEEPIVYRSEPISITMPQIEDKSFRTLIVNSANRDWINKPLRNNIDFKLSTDTQTNTFYPQLLLLPSSIKNITPYVLLQLSDEFTEVFYSFTCAPCTFGKWENWVPVENAESISLNSNNWSMKLFDHAHNIIDMGSDNIQISKVFKEKDLYKLFLSDDNLSIEKNDTILLKFQNGKSLWKQVFDVDKTTNILSIVHHDNNLSLQDFVDCKMLVGGDQFSLILKYCTNSTL